jgi:hypothetical protein
MNERLKDFIALVFVLACVVFLLSLTVKVMLL